MFAGMFDEFLTSRSLMALPASGSTPEWIQLTPVSTGTFSTRDGRGPFTIKNAADVIKASLAMGINGAIGIDYDHATDLLAKTGGAAPAAGWIDEMRAQGPNGEPGIWAKPKWTAAAKTKIDDGEYRGVSPVLLSRKDSDELVAIGRVALTNDPAILMKGLFFNQENDDVNRTQLCAALSLPATATDSDILGAAKKSAASRKQLASAVGVPETASDDDLMAAVKKLGPNQTMASHVARILEAAGLTGELDDTLTAALCTKLKSTTAVSGQQAQIDELQKTVASLSARLAGRDAETEVAAAVAAGKITPAQKDWAVDYCARDPQGFKTFVEKAPVVLVGGKLPEQPLAEGDLTASEKNICATLGIKEEDFKATRATLKKEAV